MSIRQKNCRLKFVDQNSSTNNMIAEKDDRNLLHVDATDNRDWPQQMISLWKVIILHIVHTLAFT